MWTAHSRWQFGPNGGIWEAAPGELPSTASGVLGESYLELANVDLDDDEAIIAFVRRWGILGIRWRQDVATADRVEVRDYSHLFGQLIYDGYEDEEFVTDEGLLIPQEDPEYTIPTVLEELAESVSDAELGDRPPPETPVEETMDEFRAGAWLMRDLLRAYRWQANDVEPDTWEWPINQPVAPDLTQAIDWFSAATIPLLAPFHPQFLTVETYEGEPYASMVFYGNVSLLNVMALELYNHACEKAEYKTCANETCGRLFVRQSGRAKEGVSTARPA